MGFPDRFQQGDLACFLGDPGQAGRWYEPLLSGFREFGMTNSRRQAMSLAQMGHESTLFTVLEEDLSYSPGRLMEVWPARFRSYAQAVEYARDPQKLGNLVYGGRLGNTAPGDGYRFRGRGLIQLTGRANYAAAGKALGLPLLQNPDLLLQPVNAARAACWFVSTRRLLGISWLTYADWGNLTVCTRLINGGALGLENRKTLYDRAKACLQVP